ncbi:DUF4333 domain-containing protein [Nocardioides ungokensis]|uniref:DUF4333 domain-containing protein n=1 Tax=Nocardioides ungokensis TaxID=1643322 RepID=UPI0015DE0E4E|nr:DUF4333 domain-containing protein [Nocardioides ungokensis]
MTKYAALAVLLLAITGCSGSVSTSSEPKAVSQSDLEQQVSGMYTPNDPQATVGASCSGDLTAKVDATQDCHLTVGKQSADVRVTVTSVDGSDTKFDAVPFIPGTKVADTIKSSLTSQGYNVDSVDCQGELMGKVGETATCTVAPAKGGGTIEATVTKVDGLLVNFNYKVVQ